MSENTVDTSQRVVLDYTSRDYKAIRAQLVGLAKGLMPEWQTAGEAGDFGTLLLELFAYSSDVMNYYADRVSAEAFLGTAARRQSVMFIADMLGYTPTSQRAAAVPLTFTWTWEDGTLNDEPYTISSASVTENVVTLGIASEVYGITIQPGQTIDVEGTGDNEPYNGRFIVEKVVPAKTGEDFKLTYRVPDTADDTLSPVPANALVRAGLVITIPEKTPVFGGVGETRIQFETDYAVVLDSANGRDTAVDSGDKTVSAYVTATEGTTVAPTRIGLSSGIPNAEFVLPQPGVINNSISVYTKEGGQVVTWTEVDKISLASPTQSAYATYVDDEDYTHILFGDNASGRIPPVGAAINAGFRYGVGSIANSVAVNGLTSFDNETANDAGVTVTNSAIPTGGEDVESIESIRYSVPRANARRQRAVTLDDYNSLTLQVPGVNKAVAYGSNYTTVYVRIASGPSSTGYITTDITGVYVKDGKGLITLDKDALLAPKQILFLENVSGIFADSAVSGSVAAESVYVKTTPTRVTSVKETSATNTLEITTDKAHGFNIGQPITLTTSTDIPSAYRTVYAGTHVITERKATTFTITLNTDITTDNTVTVTDTAATVIGTPGFTFSTTEPDSNPLVWTAAVSATATTTDASMQRLINAVEQYLADKKLIGSVVYAEPVEWTNVDVDLDVVVRPLYNRESVRAAVQAAITNVFAFDNVNFGKRISIGDVYRAALTVDGVDYITLNTLKETTSAGTVEDINSLDDDPLNAYRIPRLNPSLAEPWVSATGGLANS